LTRKDNIINQTLVYASLTALFGGLYAGLIIGLKGLASLIGGNQRSGGLAMVY
jgi:hypothetical protein